MDNVSKSLKIKPMSEEQLIISADRLTRFKHPETKYTRVFKDILNNNLIQPKFKKRELDNVSYVELRDYAAEIINYSLVQLGFNLSDNFLTSD